MNTPETATPPAAASTADAGDLQTLYAERRARLMSELGEDAALVVFSNPVRNRSNDTDYDYRQSSDILYLTGFAEPESVLALLPGHDEHEFVLFLRERDPKHEIWDGERVGVERAAERVGSDRAFAIKELDTELPKLLAGRSDLYFALGKDTRQDEQLIRAMKRAQFAGRRGRPKPYRIVVPDGVLHEMRLIKSAAEIDAMRTACRISAEGHVRGMQMTRPGMTEYELQAEIEYVFKRAGASSPGYPSIVGTGANACVLHYIENRATMQDGELVLVDAGAEVANYTGDITRTWPVNGRFTERQREIYDLVLRAQVACIDEVKPGTPWSRFHEVAARVISEGLIDLGIIEGPLDDAIEQKRYHKWYMHGTGHWLGIDVHDVGIYSDGHQDAEGKPAGRPLEPGMVFTIEPGIYFHPETEGCPDAWRGIGVRIEDDVLVTADGCEVLSAAVPKDPTEVEALVGTAL